MTALSDLRAAARYLRSLRRAARGAIPPVPIGELKHLSGFCDRALDTLAKWDERITETGESTSPTPLLTAAPPG